MQALVQRDLFQSAVVSDYLFQKDRIFASINLSDEEMRLYDQILPAARARAPQTRSGGIPAGGSIDHPQENRERGRSFERGIDPDYLSALDEAYKYFFFHYRATPLLVVNTDAIDVVGRPEDREELIRRVLAHDKGTAYYNPG